MHSNQQYSPLSPVDEASHNFDGVLEGSRESVELEDVRYSRQSSFPHTDRLEKNIPPTNSKVFDSNRQTWKLFFPQFIRWLVTIAFITLMLATLKFFENSGNFSPNSKHAFNTLITALSLGLGLNFFEAFKDIAKILRWRILASRRHSVREVDLILSIESLSKVVELAVVCRKKPFVVISCFSWLSLNLIAQGAVAILGLNYSVDSGTNWKGTYMPKGTVNAYNLTCFADDGECIDLPQVEQIQAHLYGQIAYGYPCQVYNDISEVLDSDTNALIYCKQVQDQQEFSFRFSEIDPRDTERIYPHFTNRIITASSGQCYQYNIIDGSNQPALTLNGDDAAVSWEYSNGTVNGSVIIPTQYSGYDGTTYIYPGLQVPQNETEYSCGPRCMWMWAFKAISTLPFDQGQPMALYKCPITISPVTNVTDDAQELPDGMAKLAATAIALQGRCANPPQDNGTTVWTQYQYYPWGSAWEIHNRRIDEVGADIAYFALGSIAWMATTNPTFATEGLVPKLGFSVNVHWNYIIALCACIVGVHFIIFATAIYTSRLVIIKDDTFLSTARLLKPLVEHLGPRATLLGGKELSKAIEEYVPRGVIYGPREGKEISGTVLDLAEDVPPRKRLNAQRHPDGRYL